MGKVQWFDIEGTRVPMKKSKLGWRVVSPIKREDGSLHFFNLLTGGWGSLFITTLIVIILVSQLYLFRAQLEEIESHYEKIAADPIQWCKDVNSGKTNAWEYSDLTISAEENLLDNQE